MLRKALLTVTGVLAAVCTGLFVSQGVTNVHADNADDTPKVIEYTLDDEEYRAKLDKMQKELEEKEWYKGPDYWYVSSREAYNTLISGGYYNTVYIGPTDEQLEEWNKEGRTPIVTPFLSANE